MAKNITTETRFSLNGSNIPRPIAESTMNLDAMRNGLKKVVSPVYRSNSNACLLQNGQQSPQQASNSNVGKNKSKIDARTYTDVQSNGLASRIIKYHENSSRLNRSSSLGNLYSKPGQFPVVHLKRTEIPLRTKKHNLSMTRIAPPEKSIFHGNTISSLLRSNSVVGLQKSDGEISAENRPIIHPPPNEDDIVPTRSVLDVLKEISRKRINSDEDEGRVEATLKKYCNRDGVSHEVVDSNQPAWQCNSYNPTPIAYKRQRDQVAPRSPSSVVQTSPTQQTAKARRIISSNNDITSSLSSSLLYSNKRKLNNTPTKRSPVASDDPILHRTKMQRQQTQEISEQNSTIPISSTPPRSHRIQTQQKEKELIGEPMRTLSVPTTNSSHQCKEVTKAKPTLTLFNKNYVVEEESKMKCTDGKSFAEEENDNNLDKDDAYAGVQFVKPKKGNLLSGSKHPLIQRTQKSKLALMLCGLRGELYHGDVDEVEAPKYQNDAPPTTIAPTITTKILPTTTSSITSTITQKNTVTTPTTTNAMTTTTTTTINKDNKKVTSPLVGIKLTPQNTTSPTKTNTTTTTTSSSVPVLQGFNFGGNTSSNNNKLTNIPTLTMGNGAFNFGNSNATTTTTTSTMTTTTTTSTLPTFAFSQSNTTISTTSTSNTAPQTTKATFAFGTAAINSTTTTTTSTVPISMTPIKTSTFAFGTPTTTTAAAAAATTTTTATVTPFNLGAKSAENTTTKEQQPIFSFGTQKTATIATTQTPAVFSFGSATNTTTVANNATTSITTTQPQNLFSFGNTSTTNNAIATTTTAAATPSQNLFGFGNKLTTTANSVTTTTAAPTLFAFGNTTTKAASNPVTTTTQISSPFGFGITTTTASNATTKSPAFATSMQSNLTNTGGFSFGSMTKPTATASPFSLVNNNNNNNTAGVFGATAQTTANNVMNNSTTFTFGGGSTQQQQQLQPQTNAFGANTTVTAPAASAAPASSANLFAFGAKPAEKTLTNSFSFNAGAAADNTTTNNNLFGNKNNEQNNVKPAFNFNNNNNNNNIAAVGGFGGIANSASKPFAFGSTTNNNNSNAGSANIFGAATNTASFGSVAAQNTINNTNATTTATPAFSFGSKPATNPSETNKPFTFGAPATATAATPQSNNLFGNATNVSAVTPTFNFTATAVNGGNTGNTAAPNPNVNIFAPTNSDRPIRRATRRLNKPANVN